MAGGLRYEGLADMPPGMREQVVEKILEKYAGLDSQIVPPEESHCSEECILWWECNGVAIDEECPWRE